VPAGLRRPFATNATRPGSTPTSLSEYCRALWFFRMIAGPTPATFPVERTYLPPGFDPEEGDSLGAGERDPLTTTPFSPTGQAETR
jgi:hypothetical protein